MDQAELKKRTDEAMADIGLEAEDILRKKGMQALNKFLDSKLPSYKAKWGFDSEAKPSVPLTQEMVELRERIGQDLQLRLKMGPTSFASSSFSSIEDRA